jgi:hypothetical protein
MVADAVLPLLRSYWNDGKGWAPGKAFGCEGAQTTNLAIPVPVPAAAIRCHRAEHGSQTGVRMWLDLHRFAASSRQANTLCCSL